MFFKPRITTSEIISFLNEKQSAFIECNPLNKKEREQNIFNRPKRFSLDDFPSEKSEYKIIGYSQIDNKYEIYYVEITSWFPPFGKRVLKFIQEKDPKTILELQEKYNQEVLIKNDKCPACNSRITINETHCNNCGLNLEA